MKENDSKLESQITALKRRLIDLEPCLEDNEYLNVIYNKIVLRKAVLTKAYKDRSNRPTVLSKIKKLLSFHKKEKLICDYFKPSLQK